MDELNSQGYLQRNSQALAMVFRLSDACLIVSLLYLNVWSYSASSLAQNPDLILILALESLICFHVYARLVGIYRSWRGTLYRSQALAVLKAWCLTFSTLLLLNYQESLKLEFLLPWFLFTLAGMLLLRLCVRIVLQRLRVLGFNSRSVAIAGGGKTGVSMAGMINSMPELGLRLCGLFDDRPQGSGRLAWQGEIAGNFAELIQGVREKRIDIVYITLPLSAEERISALVDALSDTTASVYIVPDLFLQALLDARWSTFQSVPVISVFDSPFFGIAGWIKRLQDIIIALLVLVLILVPMLIIGLAVKLSSPGPVIFKQRRYGIDGREIRVWKFRSMRTLDDGAVIHQAGKEDPRITTVGRFLRRTSLDELPQFFNVLQGDMSIVGPRPHAVAHNETYRKQIKKYMLRHSVKPGITGWAQVNGWRGETDVLDKMEKRVECDLWYIRHWSFWLDIKIVCLTVVKGFVNDKAY